MSNKTAISVKHVPMKALQKIDKLVSEGKYVSRSDFVRNAIRDLLAFHFPTVEAIRFRLGLTEIEEEIIIEDIKELAQTPEK